MKNFQLSEQDKKIVSLLRANSRASYKQIAKKVGVSITTVHNTIKRLKKNGVIKKFSVKMHSSKIGYDLTVVIGLMLKQGYLREVEERLVAHSNVCQVFVVTGEYDLIVVAKFKNTKALQEFIRDFLQKMTGTERTNTSVVLTTVKERLNPQF
ncbi:winged helix-turn-helix transcriptional regulator [archaeon]|nr:winged helix-turn-helix transcriptional regulator [archaeon]